MTASPDPPELDDPRLFAALEEYHAAVAAGRRPDRGELLARYVAVADALAGCLDAFDFVGGVASATPPHLHLVPGMVFGDYRLIREVGRGGMGVVFEANHLRLGRRVALKVLPHVGSLDARQLQRFRNEVQAAAGLAHPHIVPVHAADCIDGVHFFTMQFIDGQTLAQWIGALRRGAEPGSTQAAQSSTGIDPATPVPPSTPIAVPANLAPSRPAGQAWGTREDYHEAARLMEEAARALHYAHQVGVVHRDIKPGNLLLDSQGRVWVTDFGLAKLPGSELTASGDLLGTLRYMSPEQASGRSLGVDHRTDVYSLGATLYELLALRPAFPGDDRLDVLQRIQHVDPVSALTIRPGAPRELDLIARKALAKAPGERYATAEEMADDLRRFLEDRPILARPPSLALRARKWARRNRALVALAGVALAVFLVASVAGLAVSNAHISAEKEKTEEALLAKKKALEAEQLARQDALDAGERSDATRYVHTVARAHREWLAGNPARVRQLLDSCPEKYRGWEWRYLNRLPASARAQVTGSAKSFVDFQYSPDGTRFATVNDRGEVQFWDAETGEAKGNLRLDHRALKVVYHPDGKSVAVLHPTRSAAEAYLGSTVALPPDAPAGWVSRVEIATSKLLGKFTGHNRPILHLAFSPDGKHLVGAAQWTSRMLVWNVADGKLAWEGKGAQPAFSPDSQLLASRLSGRVTVHFAADGRLVRDLETPLAAGPLVFHPNGQSLASGTTYGSVMVWPVGLSKRGTAFRTTLSRTVDGLAYSPDGKWLAASAGGRQVVLLESNTGRPELTFHGPADAITQIAFHPNGTQLALAAGDGIQMKHLFDDPEHRLLRSARWHLSGKEGRGEYDYRTSGHIASLAFDPTGKQLALCHPSEVTVYELQTGRTSGRSFLALGDIRPASLLYARSDNGLTVAGRNGALARSTQGRRDWEHRPFEIARKGTFRGAEPLYQVEETAFNDIGEAVAFLAGDGRLTVRATRTGATLARVEEKHDPAKRYALALDKSGSRLAVVGHEEEALKIFDLANQRQIVRRPAPIANVLTLRYSPDGRSIAVAGADGRLALLDSDSGTVKWARSVPRQPRMALAFSPDGSRLALTQSRDDSLAGGVILFEGRTGEELLTLPCDAGVSAVAFSPDGSSLAAAVDAGILLWETALPTRDRLALRRQRVDHWHRDLARTEVPSRGWFAQEWHQSRLVLADPTQAEWLSRRALTRLNLGRKSEALADARLALSDRGAPRSVGLAYPPLRVVVELGDRALYRQWSERVADRLERDWRSRNSLVDGLQLLTLVPDALSAERYLRLAQRLLTDKGLTPAQLRVIGMAYYRAGRFTEASQYFRKALASEGPKKLNWLLLSLSESRRGKKGEAKKAFDQARKLKDPHFSPPSAANPIPVFYRKQLQREAELALRRLEEQ